jgi:hypothetical protein
LATQEHEPQHQQNSPKAGGGVVASLEWRRPWQDAWPESRVAVAFASEVLWIFR